MLLSSNIHMGVRMSNAGRPDAHDAAIERAVVALRRSQSRRTLARLARGRGRGGPPEGVVELLDAVAAAGRAAVTEAAAAMGTDQARASRLAGRALAEGLVRRGADPEDGRRSPLELTGAGEEVLARVAEFRRSVVAEATRGWARADREALAVLLGRFAADFSAAAGGSQERPR